MEFLFWASAATVFYVYAGYPLLLAVWSQVARRRRTSAWPAEGEEFITAAGGAVVDPWGDLAVAHESDAPGVSIVIAARNEAARLLARVENLLLQDYDGDTEVIVVSDGSTDDPGAALHGLPDNVRLIEIKAAGKAAALNTGVEAAQHDILVFADARQTFAPDALRHLVAPFADPNIGGVTGELVLDSELSRVPEHDAPEHDAPEHGDAREHENAREHAHPSTLAPSHPPRIAEGVGVYWRYEKALRRMESVVGSTLGATGAIYALRRSLWQPLPPDTILDDVLAPMRAVLAGFSVVFESRAKAFDRASRDAATESRRKVRTLAGNVQILWLEPRLLLPSSNPVWLQYLSHKVGRLVVPYFLVLLLIASAVLAPRHWLYEFALMVQLAFYALALWGTLLADRAARIAWTFVVLNYSAVAGAVSAVTRRKVWR